MIMIIVHDDDDDQNKRRSTGAINGTIVFSRHLGAPTVLVKFQDSRSFKRSAN
jgi:hypothetical protein